MRHEEKKGFRRQGTAWRESGNKKQKRKEGGRFGRGLRQNLKARVQSMKDKCPRYARRKAPAVAGLRRQIDVSSLLNSVHGREHHSVCV